MLEHFNYLSHHVSVVGWASIPAVFKTPVFRVPWHRGWSKQAQHVSLHADDWQSRFSLGMYVYEYEYVFPSNAARQYFWNS